MNPGAFLHNADVKLPGRSEQLHLSVYAVHTFRDRNGRMPEDNKEDLSQVVHIANEIVADLKSKKLNWIEEVDKDIVEKTATYSTCSITSMCSFLGGIVALEIIKFTGMYTPFKQWFHYDVFESIPDNTVNRKPMNCRYDD